jgi:RNA-binding motif protein, X-linked 2
LSENDLKNNSKSSWHDQYKDSAWLFLGGLPYDLTEGDIISVFSQYGEIANINLIRDKKTGKQKGFCFLCYEDQRSTVLAVDNLNGIKVGMPMCIGNSSLSLIDLSFPQILKRTIRVDHVQQYKVPKDSDKLDEVTRKLQQEGCAPIAQLPEEYIKKEKPASFQAASSTSSVASSVKPEVTTSGMDIKLPMRLPIGRSIKQEPVETLQRDVKVKKEKKAKKEKKKRKKRSSSSDSSSSESDSNRRKKRK